MEKGGRGQAKHFPCLAITLTRKKLFSCPRSAADLHDENKASMGLEERAFRTSRLSILATLSWVFLCQVTFAPRNYSSHHVSEQGEGLMCAEVEVHMAVDSYLKLEGLKHNSNNFVVQN